MCSQTNSKTNSHSTEVNSTQVNSTRVIFALCLLSCILRLINLSSRSLWLDEYTSFDIAGKSLRAIISGSGFDNHTPPGYYLILHFWISLVGHTEAGLRSLSLVFDLLNVALIVSLFSRLFSREVGIGTGIFYACSSYAIYYAQEGRMYTLLLCLVLLTGRLGVDFIDEETGIGKKVALIIIGTLGMYTHYYYALSLIAITLGVTFSIVDKKRLLHWYALVGVVAVLFLPWLQVVYTLLGSGGQPFRKFVFSVLPYTVFRFVAGYGVMPLQFQDKEKIFLTIEENIISLILYGGAFLFAGVFGIRELKRRYPSYFWFYLSSLLIPPLCALLISLKAPLLSERYLIVIFPFCLCLFSVFFCFSRGRIASFGKGLVTILFGYSLFMHYANENFGNTQWREAAQFLKEKAPPGSVVIVNPGYSVGVLKYYSGNVLEILPMEPELVEISNLKKDLSTLYLLELDSAPVRVNEVWKKEDVQIVQEIAYPLESGIQIFRVTRKHAS